MYEIIAAFLAGLASFFTPCILPIAPGFVSALAGTVHSQKDLTYPHKKDLASITSPVDTPAGLERATKTTRKTMFLATGYFVLGFALVFALIGTIIACFCTNNVYLGLQLKHTIAYIGGVVMIALGIFMILSTKVARLNFTKMISLEKVKGLNIHTAYITAFIFGATFAAGWTPCVGPLLASILTLAVEHPETAYNELLVYAIGLGVPFLIISLFISEAQKLMRPLVKKVGYFDLIMGVLLVGIGVWFLWQQLTPNM